MLSSHDLLAFCSALQRLSRFTPAELALSSRRRLRLAQQFLHSAVSLVRVESVRGHDPRRPLREYWTVVDDRLPLYREIERLRAETNALSPVGDLFNGIDRLLRDVAASEQALNRCPTPDAEQVHLTAQRRGIDHALVDVEVSIARAVRARRRANRSHEGDEHRSLTDAPKPAGFQFFYKQLGPALLDWSSPAAHGDGDMHGMPLSTAFPLSDEPLAYELARLASCSEIDDEAIGRTVSTLCKVRAGWAASIEFGEALDAEFRHLLRQAFGHRLLGPLAVVAVAMAETACARSLFEGWVMFGGSTASAADSLPLVPAALARLAFETHLQASKKWTENPAASMCRYVLTTPLNPLGTLLAATGSLLSEAPDLERIFASVALSYEQISDQVASDIAASVSRSLWLALFLQTGRPAPVTAIQSLPELPGGERLFDALLNRDHGAVVYRLDRLLRGGQRNGEQYELRPGSAIKPLLVRPLGESEIRLAMPVTGKFERRRAMATAPERWTLAAASPMSFLGELEASGRTH